MRIRRLAVLILLIAAGIGMQDHQRLTTVRSKHAELLAAASKGACRAQEHLRGGGGRDRGGVLGRRSLF